MPGLLTSALHCASLRPREREEAAGQAAEEEENGNRAVGPFPEGGARESVVSKQPKPAEGRHVCCFELSGLGSHQEHQVAWG